MNHSRIIKELAKQANDEAQKALDELTGLSPKHQQIKLNNLSGNSLDNLNGFIQTKLSIIKSEANLNQNDKAPPLYNIENLEKIGLMVNQTYEKFQESQEKMVEFLENQRAALKAKQDAYAAKSTLEKQVGSDYAAYMTMHRDPKYGENGSLKQLMSDLTQSKERYNLLVAEIKRRNPDEKSSASIIRALDKNKSDFIQSRISSNQDEISPNKPTPSG